MFIEFVIRIVANKEPCCLDCGAYFNVGEEQFCIKNCLITSLLKNLFQSFLGLMKEYEASRETKYEDLKKERKILTAKEKISPKPKSQKTNSNDITIKQQAYQDLKTAYSDVNECYKHSLDNYITEILLE
nr:13313_t:CDS:2 [Entrophospora candida]